MAVTFPPLTLNCSDCRTHFIHMTLKNQINVNLEVGSTFWAPRTKNGPVMALHVENNLINKWIRYDNVRERLICASLAINNFKQLCDALQMFIAGGSSQSRSWCKHANPHLTSLVSVKIDDQWTLAFCYANFVCETGVVSIPIGLHSTLPAPIIWDVYGLWGTFSHFGSLSLSFHLHPNVGLNTPWLLQLFS